MVRVLLVVDDYNEMIYLQTVLKKIGFDVEGLQSSRKFVDSSLGFNPQIVVASALGKKVDVLGFGQDIRKNRGLPKILALRPAGRNITQDQIEAAGVDRVIDTPVNIQKLVLGITTLVGVDESGFLDKLAKLQAKQDPDLAGEDLLLLGSLDDFNEDFAGRKTQSEIEKLLSKPIHEAPPVQETPVDTPKVDLSIEEISDRRERFDKFLAEMEKPDPGHFRRERILQFNKQIRSLPRPEDLDEVEAERKNFVRALFKKPNNNRS